MRISRPQMFMEMAEVASRRATCLRGNIGAILTYKNDVISMGYNGPPSGEDHCYGNSCPLHNSGCTRSLHAEKNAWDRALLKMPHLQCMLMDMYCTSAPCPSCASLVGVSRFFYRYPYRLMAEGIDRLHAKGTSVYRILQSGSVIREKTGEIIDPEFFNQRENW